MFSPSTLALLSLALLIEAAVSYPAPLYSAIGHPVTWMGRWLGFLEARLNRAEWSFALRRTAGALALLALLGLTGAITLALQHLLPAGAAGLAAAALLASSLLAQRSLFTHVRAVALALDNGGLDAGRSAVAMIVGRNPQALDEAGVARAAIESLAENFTDGVVAPAFYIALGGLTGGALYKAANTADSMTGHRSPRYEAFGWAAARFDDGINLPASRLAALWLVLAALLIPGADAGEAIAAVWRDAGKHRSPNAGWPEAAMAGALGLQLAGPRVYGETMVDDAYMGAGRRAATAADVWRALRLYQLACLLQFGAVAMAAIALGWRG